jgi:error-prone DNA polymerase
MQMSTYAELAATTNFSFLRGASHPEEIVACADELGLTAIGIADRNSFAGVVRAYDEAKKRKIKLLVGVRLVTTDGFEALTYPTDRAAYGRLCRLITAGNLKAKKSECHLSFAEIINAAEGQIFIALPPPALFSDSSHSDIVQKITSPWRGEDDAPTDPARSGRPDDKFRAAGGGDAASRPHIPPRPLRGRPSPTRGGSGGFTKRLSTLAAIAPGRTFLAGVHYHRGDEPRRLGLLAELGARCGAPLIAVNDVLYHAPERRPLLDVVTCIREKCTIADAGLQLSVNAERHLKAPGEMARLFAAFPDAIDRTLAIVRSCRFSLGELNYEYPDEPVPPGKTAQEHLEDLTWAGAQRRYPKDKYPDGIPDDVRKRLNDELAVIAKLHYARYFLTVHDVVSFARTREKEILCQGRGSAANSAVCFCLGITSVDPGKSNLLFARFISENRSEPPDIDVDFEHERREEVIQYIYRRYGRHRAAICATVVHYRSRRAIREVGKALGLTEDVTAALAKTVWGYGDGYPDDHIRQAGLDPANSAIRQAVALADALIGFPRHLSQHVGGFVLTRGPLDETVPIGNAAMDDRTFIEWDKDDIDTLGLMKVDVLGLGMLSCLRRSLDLLKAHYGLDYSLAALPQDDPAVYQMLSRADSVGVFQVESRAQMSMLPRLKPQCFYDLVIEVAIVRPGPIQGDMVHPYLRRRDGIEKEYYPSPSPAHGPRDELRDVLKRTLGVPLFQEQAMQIAITAAKFTPDEADGLRRAMATFRHTGKVHLFRDKFINGMVERGYERDFAEHCFGQIEGFGEYGFPESHAASFALLVYASAFVKCRYPDVFCAAILNSQPMGFYQPAQLVRDARQHGVEIRPVDVNFSNWDCTLEPTASSSAQGASHAVRLGFRLVHGLAEQELQKLIAARGNGFSSIERLAAIAGISRFTIERLAEADAFRSIPHDPAKWEPVRRQDHASNIKSGSRSDAQPVPAFADRAPGFDRRAALWAARRLDTIGIRRPKSDSKFGGVKPGEALPLLTPHLSEEFFPEASVALPAMPLCEHVVEDYVTTGLSLKQHPVQFFRERLLTLGAIPNAQLRDEALAQDLTVTVAGLVLVRQRPGTSKGVVFMTLEDETDIANIIVWPKVFVRNRRTVMTSRFLAVRGRLQRAGLVIHVVAESFTDLSAALPWLRDGDLFSPKFSGDARPEADALPVRSRDFH